MQIIGIHTLQQTCQRFNFCLMLRRRLCQLLFLLLQLLHHWLQ